MRQMKQSTLTLAALLLCAIGANAQTARTTDKDCKKNVKSCLK